MSKQRITPGGVVIAENVPVPLSALDRAADAVRLATADERDAMLAVDRELLVRQIWGLQSRLLGLEAELAEAGGGTVRCVVDGCHNLVLGYRLNWLGLATCSPTCERQLRRARAETRAAAAKEGGPKSKVQRGSGGDHATSDLGPRTLDLGPIEEASP